LRGKIFDGMRGVDRNWVGVGLATKSYHPDSVGDDFTDVELLLVAFGDPDNKLSGLP